MIPGSKSTIGDLSFLVEQGWDIDIQAHIRQRKLVLGICGGYQMLGKLVSDPLGIEGNVGTAPGLGLLDVTTKLTRKSCHKVSTISNLVKKLPAMKYILDQRMGQTVHAHLSIRSGNRRKIRRRIVTNGLVLGTYVHGLFIEDEFRHAFLQYCGLEKLSMSSFDLEIETALDEFSEHLDKNIDVPRLFGPCALGAVSIVLNLF